MKDFRYNAWYGPEKAPQLNAADYRLQLAGLIADKQPWTVEKLYALPQVTQVTRHVCVEGWSMIGKWSGTPLREFLKRIGADTTAKYVGFECADGYYEGIDMPTALHPQTLMAFKLSDDILPTRNGYPFKIRIPTKLGFQEPEIRHDDLRHQPAAARVLDGSRLQLVQRDLSAWDDAERCAIGVMAKAPQAGRSKTRLCPPLQPEQAAALSAASCATSPRTSPLAARHTPIDRLHRLCAGRHGGAVRRPSGGRDRACCWRTARR